MRLTIQDITEEQLDNVDINKRERAIMKLRNGFTDGQPRSFQYVGEVFGVTRERIRQIQNKVIEKIKNDDI